MGASVSLSEALKAATCQFLAACILFLAALIWFLAACILTCWCCLPPHASDARCLHPHVWRKGAQAKHQKGIANMPADGWRELAAEKALLAPA